MFEWVQFKTNKKKELRQIAKSQGLTLNTLMVLIVNDYLKKVGNEN